MSKIVLTDTCYWIGLLDSKDQHHDASTVISDLLINQKIVIPWPCLYETISTYLIRRKDRLSLLEQIIRSNSNIEFIDDTEYRNKALNNVFEANNKYTEYSHSLVDAVLREMLSDINLRIDYLITFNNKDFIDICIKRGIEIINE
jgi:predicted nucleic acid-binding protein